MTPEQFAYWLKGFAELNPQAPNAEQWQAIRDHLQLVFKKETPIRVAEPVRAPSSLEEAIRQAAERQREQWPISPFRPNDPYWLKQPVITC